MTAHRVHTAALASATDAELGAALGASVVRSAWPYASSFPMEELHITGAVTKRLLFKDLSAKVRPRRPEFLADPLREIAVYREILEPLGIDAPACHAAVADARRAWLFLELVEGQPLWQFGEIEIWEATARWLAALHALTPPTAARLLTYDAAHLRRRFALAKAIPRSAEIGEGLAERLAGLPVTFIHGEFYASNVLIQREDDAVRVRPVDWETAGIGPGVLDLAALTAGSWSEEKRSRIERSYIEACPPSRRPAPDDLNCARLLLAAQWLGWSSGWTPPPEHAHDWRTEAMTLIERLGL